MLPMLKPRYRLSKEPAHPLPGSAESQQAGCTCPRSPNDGGWGVSTIDGLTWWVDTQCPIHSVTHTAATKEEPKCRPLLRTKHT